jgi:hypothetical protein
MKRRRAGRIVIASVVGVAAWFAFAGVAQAAYGGYDGWPGKKGLYGSMCASAVSLCADPSGLLNGQYVGHDEPSLEFKSNLPGSGNDMSYS